MRQGGTIDIDELKELANGQVRALAKALLPNGTESCGFWQVGSIGGEKGQSLKLNLDGASKGLWTDFSVARGTPQYSGNLIQLAAQVRFGGDVGAAIKWLTSWLGLDNLDPDRLKAVQAQAREAAERNAEEARAKIEKTRGRALNLFLSGVPIPGTPAERYLCARGIDLRDRGMTAPGSLRFHPAAWCTEKAEAMKAAGCTKREISAEAKLPAMLGAIVDRHGKHLGTHRTYLLPNGSDKARLKEAKKSWGLFQGGFIPLWKGEQKCSMAELRTGTPIYASEGIEDGLSVAIMRPDRRIIAAVSLSNMGGLDLPPDCPLYILGQRDKELKAIEAFESVVERQEAAGRQVFLCWPPKGYKDYNEPIDRRGPQA